MPRVVLDTNVLVSALFWEGNEREVLRRCRAGDLRSVTSPGILEELERVLVRKFKVPEDRARDYLRELLTISEVVLPPGELTVVARDRADNVVLETAVVGKADVIVTGDRHLLGLGGYENIVIERARDL